MENKQKILVCGTVNGKFKQLFNRIESINRKSGPFDLLLCVGSFFHATDNSELEAFKNGNAIVSVPTYILHANTPDEIRNFVALNDDGEICTNLTCLGKLGLYTTTTGLKIAYVSGAEAKGAISKKSEWNFNHEDVLAVKKSCLFSPSIGSNYRGIDILLTAQWPNGIGQLSDEKTSNLLSWLALEIKPRYHFSGQNNVFYEREPYRTSPCPHTQLELATRFISLASVGNKTKSKYIYALNIAPVDKLRIIDLIQKTTNETPCPYERMHLIKDRDKTQEKKSAQYFYEIDSIDGSNSHNKKRKSLCNYGCEESKRHLQSTTINQDQCWFCLSSPSVEKHLVITIGDYFYLAMDKGPIDDTHLLILSVTHIKSASLLTMENWIELQRFKIALRNYYKNQNKVVVFFERNYKSLHVQLNVIAINAELECQLKMTFINIAEKYQFNLEELPKITKPTQLPNRGPYFTAELPNGVTLLTRQMRHFPLAFGREVFCAETLLDCKDKIDWKQCTQSKDGELLMVKQIRESFKPYDFTLN